MREFLIEFLYLLFCVVVFLAAWFIVPFWMGVKMLGLFIKLINKPRRRN